MTDRPLLEIAEMAEIQIGRGATIWQKFTCANCGVRQTMDTPDVLYTEGRCQECDYVTDLRPACGFMLVHSSDRENHDEFVRELTEDIRATPKGGYDAHPD